MYYVVNLRESQRTSKLNINSLKIHVNDIVLVFYEKVHFWRIGIVTPVLPTRGTEIGSNSENCKDQYNPQTSHK